MTLAPNDPRHGTVNGYSNLDCRCDRCRKAMAERMREYTHRTGRRRPMAVYSAERRAAAEARDNHGTESRYRLGCRCGECRAAAAEGRRRRRAKAAV